MKQNVMFRWAVLAGVLTLTSLAAAQTVDSENNFGSLVPQSYQSPLKRRTAHQVGDLVTIVINESQSANYTANTTTTKKDTNQIDKTQSPLIDLVSGTVLKRALGSLAGPPSKIINAIFGAQSSGANASSAGTGTTSSSGAFTTRMAAIVKEVMPNGTLVIEGSRWVKVNKDTHNIILSGLVRPDDVRTDNTVLSENIANAEIRSEGTGAIGDRQRKGILTRIMDWLF